MPAPDSSQGPPRPSQPAFWTAAVITGLLAAFLIVDGGMKLLRLAPAVEGTLDVGYPDGTVRPIGAALLAGVALYLVPRTAVLGAIVLTGYLGGAVATHVRREDPWLLLPVVMGALVWLALLLRDPRLRAMLPLRRV
jgi:hypothetical protein